MEELIQATVEHLRTTFALGADTIDNQEDGKPIPNAGQIYYAVSQGSWSNDAIEYLDERMGVNVTITFRTPYVPVDRQSDTIGSAIRVAANRVKSAIHMSYPLINIANTKLNAGQPDQGFVEPLAFLGVDPPQQRGAEWFWAEGEVDEPPTGMSVVVRFGKARRVQKIEDQVDE